MIMMSVSWTFILISFYRGWTANFVPKSAFKTVSSNCEELQHLISNPESIPSSPRSVETMDSLNLYRQNLRRNLSGQRPNVRAPEDLYRIIISRNLRIRNREYEDGYIENGAHSESGTEEESTDDASELESNEGDSELELSEDDTEVGSNNNDQHEYNEHSLNRERLTEIEGSATPAYYDRAESATPVVENYTENNPDYRWSYTVSEDLTPVSSHNTSFSPELSGNLNNVSQSNLPDSFTGSSLCLRLILQYHRNIFQRTANYLRITRI
ncbi:hypothetical protein RhiirC2_231793 [Rhizophagus irregularis]|uniref:Uncharacterized protein n=1 Tax=Rhizophagus irregularis TaxID=588596 RepID=A0A2N1NNK9_9GLOM|nr:hypothetical protein RhiirC2_231793 [Rhizophagus irregularis]